jgi:hypothetical protein
MAGLKGLDISSAENTRPEPAGTATGAAADVSAGNHFQSQ